MDWLAHVRILDDLEWKLGKLYPHWTTLAKTEVPWHAEFRRLEFDTENELHSALRQYFLTKQWPDMTTATGAMLRCRVQAAGHIARTMHFASVAIRTKGGYREDESNWLLWFLVEAWDELGFGQIHGNLQSLQPGYTPDNPAPNSSN